MSMRGGAKRSPKVLAAAILCGAALATAACSEPAEPGDPAPSPPPSSTTMTPQLVAAPTPAELNANLARAFDETVPAAEKVPLVQARRPIRS